MTGAAGGAQEWGGMQCLATGLEDAKDRKNANESEAPSIPCLLPENSDTTGATVPCY